MRTTIVFLIGLLAVSSVMSSQFIQMVQEDSDFKQEVDSIRQSNIGNIVMDLAELHEQSDKEVNKTTEGKYAPLFNAIQELDDFLGKQLLNENADFVQDTKDYKKKKNALETKRDNNKAIYDRTVSKLDDVLYPKRKELKKNIATLQKTLAGLKASLKKLNDDRKEEVRIYNREKKNYNEGIASIQKALPLLNSLVNGGKSFLEVNSEQVQMATSELSKSLQQIQYGQLFSNFVQSFAQSLKDPENLTDQKSLKKVIGILEGLLKKLQSGLVRLESQEVTNKKNYDASVKLYTKGIKEAQASLSTNQQNLKTTEAKIVTNEGIKKDSYKIYMTAKQDLVRVEADYFKRTTLHKETVAQITKEKGFIIAALAALDKAGITKESA